jgi:hypothetical protein
VAVVTLLLALLAGDRDLLGVDHDHEVAHVAVRRVLGLALAAQRVGDLSGEAAESLAGRVDHDPVALARGRCGYVGLHLKKESRSRRAQSTPGLCRRQSHMLTHAR